VRGIAGVIGGPAAAHVPALPLCALTFDDGPDPSWTPRLLARLRREQARATFFVMANRAVSHPRLIRRMLQDGHDVELHCARHVRHTDLSAAELRRDTDLALRALRRLGVAPRLWRPPWGVATPATHRLAAARGLQLVGWSADTHDWRGDVAADMHRRVRDLLGAGSVVLMHDGLGPGARRVACRETVELVPQLLKTIRSRGLRPAPLSEAVA
jgi:peptidoglycan/xylan/chitin deacetylase (PgdA/CDA1 family)